MKLEEERKRVVEERKQVVEEVKKVVAEGGAGEGSKMDPAGGGEKVAPAIPHELMLAPLLPNTSLASHLSTYTQTSGSA